MTRQPPDAMSPLIFLAVAAFQLPQIQPSLRPDAAVASLLAVAPVWAEEGFEIIGNAATADDIGVRPTVLGVPLGLAYLAFRIYLQVSIQQRDGGAGVVLINGTRTVDGRRDDSTPFLRSLSETIKAAASADPQEGGESGGRGADSKNKRGQ